MNYKISFTEMTEKGKKTLSKQSRVTLEEAKLQVQELKISSTQKNKKQRG